MLGVLLISHVVMKVVQLQTEITRLQRLIPTLCKEFGLGYLFDGKRRERRKGITN
jgi:hypothetical protein